MTRGFAAGFLTAALLTVGASAVAQEPPVIGAVARGDGDVVDGLLADGADVAATRADGTTALHVAAEGGRLDLVERLLAAGARPDAVTRYGVTPIALAAAGGHAAIVERLLAAGVDAGSVSEEGQTVLMTAARNGRVDTIELLLARGADPNATEPVQGQTALMWAAGLGNTAAVRALAGAGAAVHARSRGGFTALLFAVLHERIDTVDALAALGADVNDVAPDGTTALNMAVVNAYYDLASLLLHRGADPNRPDPRGSPLHTLAWLRRAGATGTAAVGGTANGPPVPTGRVTALELAQQLVEAGADLDVRIDWDERRFNKDGAAVTNPPDVALGRHLLTYNGATPFWVAANNGDVNLMRLLADAGADPLMPSRFGVTPLMVAAGLNYYEGESPGPFTGTPETERLAAVKLAIALGNRVDDRADFGDYVMRGDPAYTLLYYPLNVDDLVDLGVGDPRWDGSTALHGAVISAQPSIVAYLLDQGADVTAVNDLGWTPLMLAQGVFLANDEKHYPEAEELIRRALEERGLPASARAAQRASGAVTAPGPGVLAD